jgi:hypothetical protein
MLSKKTAAFLIVSAMIFGAPAAKASFVYSYTGSSFTSGATAFAGDSVSGEFTVASALGDNFTGTVTPTQFSFSNGLFSVGNSNSSFYAFDIQTSAAGAIISWSISLRASGGPWTGMIQTTSSGDSTSSLGPTTLISASNSGAPSMWSVTDPPATTPLPAALPLFAGGLGTLGLLGWRRKRKAAALAA